LEPSGSALSELPARMLSMRIAVAAARAVIRSADRWGNPDRMRRLTGRDRA